MKILVIGELCIDKFIYGEVKRLSPEAPVPVFNPLFVEENKGMAGNVVENIKELCDECDVLHWYQNDNIIKTRFVDHKSNHMFIRIDDEKIPCDKINYLTPDQRRTISESDAVIISDYDKGLISKDLIKNIASISKLTVLDSKKKLDYDTVSDVNFVKLNQTEYENNKDLCDEFSEKFIITKGKEGAIYNNKIYESPNPQQTIDVSGAGDTFVASFTLKYLKTKNISESIGYANSVCANVVNKKGVSLPDNVFKI
jgi:D-beta-D-heptose 7-phosphate kinase/D-beta-D-heptose 1-phosphate adenosyltransferase